MGPAVSDGGGGVGRGVHAKSQTNVHKPELLNRKTRRKDNVWLAAELGPCHTEELSRETVSSMSARLLLACATGPINSGWDRLKRSGCVCVFACVYVCVCGGGGGGRGNQRLMLTLGR